MTRETTSRHQTRGEAIMAAVDSIQAELLPGDEAELVVCAGPPACQLADAAREKAMDAGCSRCSRITVGEELHRA